MYIQLLNIIWNLQMDDDKKMDYLFKQYEIFRDQEKLNHIRWNDQIKIFLTLSVAIIAGKCALMNKCMFDMQIIKFVDLYLSLFGTIVCISAILSVIRIRKSILIDYSQINRIEEKLKDMASSVGLFFIDSSTEKRDFFKKSENRKIEGVSPMSCLSRSFLQLPIIITLFLFLAIGFFASMLFTLKFLP